jgi:hypothetical protein
MEPFLNSLLDTLPAIQAKQISELLQDLQQAGSVRNADEYEANLQELSAAINDTSPIPSFSQIRALSWNLCSSDAHNIMSQAMKNDLEAAFLQVDSLGTKLSDHSVLFTNGLLSDLERSLNNQEGLIRQLEWLAEKNNEFTNVLVNNFSSASLFKTSRSAPNADSLYYDNRTLKKQSEITIPSAVVSVDGNKLMLDTENTPREDPVSVTLLSDSYSYGTKYHVDDAGLENLIDKTNDTFWTYNIYTESAVEKVSAVLNFRFGSGKDVDFVVVEGVSAPFVLEEIIGYSLDGSKYDLTDQQYTIDGVTRVDFQRTNVESITLVFSVKTFKKAEEWIESNRQINNLDKLLELDSVGRHDALASVSRDVLASENLADAINVPNYSDFQTNAFLYSIVIDNIWFGNSISKDTGIFVSSPLSLTNTGVIAVEAKESTDASTIKNTIEYEIIKIDKFPKYKETRFSIPKLGQTSVSSERLVLTNRSHDSVTNSIGALRFFPYISPDYSPSDSEPIVVYKNGVALSRTLGDWTFAISQEDSTLVWQSNYIDLSFSNNSYNLIPLKFLIKLKNPALNAVYTVDYSIKTSDNVTEIESTDELDFATIWLDNEKTVYLGDSGRVYFLKPDADLTIDSDLYLQITLRRNKSSQSSSPFLYEYAVLGATYK